MVLLGLAEDKLMEELVPVSCIGVSGLNTPVRQRESGRSGMKETIAHIQYMHTEEGGMPCKHTEESQSPPDKGKFQGRRDQEKEALSGHRGVSSRKRL